MSGLRSSLGFGFKGLPVGVDCDDELMIEVVMVCAVFVLEGGKDAIFFCEMKDTKSGRIVDTIEITKNK